MERFVQLIVAGGIALVVGLWVATVAPSLSPARLAGALLAALGVTGLAAGIWTEIER